MDNRICKVHTDIENRQGCDFCNDNALEEGDTLYYNSSIWNGGISFDYVRDIKYCPICGKRLPKEFKFEK